MRRLTDLVKGLLALVLILALLVGVPLVLVVFVGQPFTDLRQAVTGELLSDNSRVTLALRGGLTVVVGLAWLQLALAFVLETVAVARGRIASRALMLPGIQTLARKLVVTATLLANVFAASPSTVSALLPLAIPPPAEHLELTVLSPAEGPGPELRFSREVGPPGFVVVDQEPAAGAGAHYTAAAGDTFWSVAEATLGDGLRWAEVREANLGRTMADGTVVTGSTEVVKAGWDLILPAGAVAPAPVTPPAASEPVAPAQVLAAWDVERGDNFWVIAEETLTARYGRSVSDDEVRPFWLELVEANRAGLVTGDADLIFPGQTFALPPSPGRAGGPGGAEGNGGAGGNGGVLDQIEQVGAGGDSAGGDGGQWTVVEPPQDPRGLSPLEPGAADPTTPAPIEQTALGLLGTAVGAGAFLNLLRRRRRLQAVRRQPGTGPGELSGPAARYENRIRSVADTEAARWLEAVNRFLPARLARQPGPALPSVLAVRAGEFGVEVLLDEACPPPDGFVDSGGGGASWRLHPELTLAQVEAEAQGAQPYCPTLVPLGRTEAGDLLVDLEQLAVVSVAGNLATVGAWMTTMATALTAMAWSQDVAVVAIGVPTGPGPAILVPADVTGWAEQVVADMTAAASRLGTSTHQRRVNGGEIHHPTVVLLGPGHDALAHRLAAAAELVHAPLVLITTTGLPGGARVELEPDRGVLVPDATGLRLEFTPVLTDSVTAARVAWLLGQATDPAADPAGLFEEVPATVRRRTLAPGPGLDPVGAGLDPMGRGLEQVATDLDPMRASQDQVATGQDPVGANQQWPPPPPLARAQRPEQAEETGPADGPGRDGLAEAMVTAPGPERERLLQPRPVEVRVLTARPRVLGVDGVAGTPIEAAIVLLGALGQVPLADLAVTLGLDPAQPALVHAALLDVAGRLGSGPDGRPRVRFDPATATCTVSDDVASDWRRARALLRLAGRATSPAEEMACLEAALGLVEGRPGAEARSRPYRWLLHDPEVYGCIETTLVDAAHRLGELSLIQGRPRMASWAANRGLLVVPGQEALHRLQMKAAAMLDDSHGVEEAYRAASRSLGDLASGQNVQQETDDLYHKLTAT